MNSPVKLTHNQEMVLNVLTHAQAPRSAYDILDSLRGEGFRAPLQVYRALDKLTEAGLVHRLESLNAFVACCHAHDHGHPEGSVTAFAICNDCGNVSEFHDHVIEERLHAWQSKAHFKPAKTTIEIRGQCERCS